MRRIATIFIALLFLLTACSGTSPTVTGPSPSVDPDEPVLTTKNVTITVWDDAGSGEEFINQAAEQFNKKYPNIQIKCECVSPSSVVSSVTGGATPDLFIIPHTEISSLAYGLLILPARDQAKAKNAVLSVTARAAMLDGVLYGYPLTAEIVTPAVYEDGEDEKILTVSATVLVRVMAVSAYSKQPDEASAFAAFLQTEDMQKLRSKLTGELPAADVISGTANAADLLEQLRYAVPYTPPQADENPEDEPDSEPEG